MFLYSAVAILLLQIFSFRSVHGIVCKDKEICAAKTEEMKECLTKLFETPREDHWDERSIIREISVVFYSEHSPFRDELRRLKDEVSRGDRAQRHRLKKAVKLNELAFFGRYDIRGNLRSRDTMLNLAKMNIFEGIFDLCRTILRDARHVAEPFNADNNSDADNCGAVTTNNAQSSSTDLDTSVDVSNVDSPWPSSRDSDASVNLSDVDETQPSSRDSDCSVDVSRPDASKDMDASENVSEADDAQPASSDSDASVSVAEPDVSRDLDASENVSKADRQPASKDSDATDSVSEPDVLRDLQATENMSATADALSPASRDVDTSVNISKTDATPPHQVESSTNADKTTTLTQANTSTPAKSDTSSEAPSNVVRPTPQPDTPAPASAASKAPEATNP